MHNKIKIAIERELRDYTRKINQTYSLSKLSPLLFKSISRFILRKGKRLRPILFVIAYLGLAPRTKPNLYTTAISFELLHDFLLVHDDIVDKAVSRRGQPALHIMLDDFIKRFPNVKFSGQDLAIVSADIIYAMAIEGFLSIKERPRRKERALSRFVASAIYTGCGEFIELLSGAKDIDKIGKEEIYRIYDYKTSHYTFAAPLACAAILAGLKQKQIDMLNRCGIFLGRAFQIRDDILGMFGDEKKTGKSSLTDLQEGKRTLLIWYAYKSSDQKKKPIIKQIFTKKRVSRKDLFRMRKLIKASGAIDYAQEEVTLLLEKAEAIIKSSRMKKKYKTLLCRFLRELLNW